MTLELCPKPQGQSPEALAISSPVKGKWCQGVLSLVIGASIKSGVYLLRCDGQQ